MLVVSLSSVPPRFPLLSHSLKSLAAQGGPVSRIVLYIPKCYRRFPDWDGRLPDVPEGVEIRRTEADYGPATKILCAARDFAGQDVDILFCDDDHVYAPGWAQSFVDLKARHRGCVIAQGGWQVFEYTDSSNERDLEPRAVRTWRITDVGFQLRYLWQDIRHWRRRHSLTAPPRRTFKRSGYVDVFEGYAGVLVRPEFFDQGFYEIPPALWTVDDVWLSGMLTLKGIPIWVEGNIMDPRQSAAQCHAPLAREVVDGVDRRAANRRGVLYFRDQHGIWP
ncbi:glycosyltransferase family A protein [Pseudoruegeria sp. HB172150]|uniref:glycosyltransferase family A protein n=1 Tax=Pseudoruegeria sp. HB172150 TaxID=2721164 RepID=UPI0015534751|nr:glycosyltransferase family A protein [Pseudoruegeria sp. HB172150]